MDLNSFLTLRSAVFYIAHIALLFARTESLGHCSVSCGNGFKTVQVEGSTKRVICNLRPCPSSSDSDESRHAVDGGWSSWSRPTPCSKTCGTGESKRTRNCTHPVPSLGGKPCKGDAVQTQKCNKKPCRTDGGWSEWSKPSPCSASCGRGETHRKRNCTNPVPANGGERCHGHATQSQPCNGPLCSVNGGWSEWSRPSSCSVTCGDGERMCSRKCDHPHPSDGGKDCVGNSTRTKHCHEKPCPVDGGWSDWSEPSPCSATCGRGEETLSRRCDKPSPAHGGRRCEGDSSQTKHCQIRPCSVHGGWSAWSDPSPCSVTCGHGEITCTRTCTNPPPANGGDDCKGESLQSKSCDKHPCAVDGGWSEWSDLSECSATCGGGEAIRRRKCDAPKPEHGGRDCDGDKTRTESCHVRPCPVDGSWSDWSEKSACSVTCGEGTIEFVRTCTNPTPAHGGRDCEGDSTRSKTCHEKPCPIDGGWSDWSHPSHCSKSCGHGETKQTRTCTNPSPTHGGEDCPGDHTRTKHCLIDPCSVDGGWSEWSDPSPCSVTCGVGETTTTRTCSNPKPEHHGKDCNGDSTQTKHCHERPCPINGGWSEWSDTSSCSVTCGEGKATCTRTCTHPRPAHGGKDCGGEYIRLKPCHEKPCRPVDGGWSEWSDPSPCSVTCGKGLSTEIRNCSKPHPAHGGKECKGISSRSNKCHQPKCPIVSTWSDWCHWSQCSVSCGNGTQTSNRTCIVPTPTTPPCNGTNTRTQDCILNPCPSPCASQPCQANERCIEAGSTFICVCASGAAFPNGTCQDAA